MILEPLDPGEKHDLQDMITRWDDMIMRTKIAEEAKKNADLLNIQLMTERDFYKEQFTLTDAERHRVTEYARDLTTRLDVIQELVRVTCSEARAFAIRPLVPKGMRPDAETEAMGVRLGPHPLRPFAQAKNPTLDRYLDGVAGVGDLNQPRPAASGL